VPSGLSEASHPALLSRFIEMKWLARVRKNPRRPSLAVVDGELENAHSPRALPDTVQVLISKPDQ
jgi:hypothetical protein